MLETRRGAQHPPKKLRKGGMWPRFAPPHPPVADPGAGPGAGTGGRQLRGGSSPCAAVTQRRGGMVVQTPPRGCIPPQGVGRKEEIPPPRV